MGHCPDCHTLQQIETTDEPTEWHTPPGGSFPLPVGSSCWALVCMHVVPDSKPDGEGRRPICAGSGKRI